MRLGDSALGIRTHAKGHPGSGARRHRGAQPPLANLHRHALSGRAPAQVPQRGPGLSQPVSLQLRHAGGRGSGEGVGVCGQGRWPGHSADGEPRLPRRLRHHRVLSPAQPSMGHPHRGHEFVSQQRLLQHRGHAGAGHGTGQGHAGGAASFQEARGARQLKQPVAPTLCSRERHPRGHVEGAHHASRPVPLGHAHDRADEGRKEPRDGLML